ncbi:MAG: MBL fold metallo-hydrolase [Mycobacterium leprae]
MEHYRLEQLAEGVFAAVADPEGWGGCNAGIVGLDDRVLLFDTGCTVPAARQLHTLVEHAAGRPASYVVNSHVHDDHINGNLLFAPSATILASEVVRGALAGKFRDKLRPIWTEVQAGIEACTRQAAETADPAVRTRLTETVVEMKAFQDALPAADEIRVPNLSFNGQLTFHGSTREARLIDCGPGHSGSDTVLWLPAEGVLFTGDLVTSKDHLVLKFGDPEAWLHVLDRLAELHPRVVIPGHGPIEPGEAALDRTRQFIRQLMQQVGTALAGGATAEYADTVPVPEGIYEPGYRDNVRFLLQWMTGRE